MMDAGIYSFLTQEELGALGRLAITSRYAVEGASAGSHRSSRKGVNVEFSDYRPYVPGDDLRQVDWRVFGKNERLYIRQSEEETSLNVMLCVDASGSMRYGETSGGKWRYACRLAAALAYLAARHQDFPGVAVFQEGTEKYLPPGNGWEHLRILCSHLADSAPAGGTVLAQSLHILAERLRRRGLVVIISDLLDDVEQLPMALAHFRRRGHDVVVYQVLDEKELSFSFDAPGIFQDMETGEELSLSPRDLREEYGRAVRRFLASCQAACQENGADYQLVRTDMPLAPFLVRHLGSRH